MIPHPCFITFLKANNQGISNQVVNTCVVYVYGGNSVE